MDSNNSQQWVEERLAKLQPQEGWHPDPTRALARLNAHRLARLREVSLRTWLFGAAAAAVACACLLAFPTSRDLVQRLWLGRSDSKMVYVGQAYADLKTLQYQKSAPDFALADATGKTIRLSDFKGRVVLLNFWATTCGGCRTEVPWLVEFQKQYEKRGLSVVGVSLDDDGWRVVNPFLREEAVNYTILLGDDQIVRLYGISAMPMTVLIDREGKISAASVGLIDRNECEKEILHLLGI